MTFFIVFHFLCRKKIGEKMRIHYCLFLVVVFLCCACNGSSKSTQTKQKTEIVIKSVPSFNPDSAYVYVEQQVLFGARVPLSEAHAKCATYLQKTMQRFADTVMVQEGLVELYDGSVVTAKNIISSYCPWSKNRILLCAHWDSRPFSDNEDSNVFTPVLGANDGASGVGVLMEIARCLAQDSLQIGIDIIFFDVEDYGVPDFYRGRKKDHTWCLGSQYWAKNPHVMGYSAKYGLLLDMVGAHKAVFPKDEVSLYFASHVVEKVWSTAKKLGYDSYFVDQKGASITDDHLYVNMLANIPCIDVIHYDVSENSFFSAWHTSKDDMSNISKETLKVVGQTLLEVIYNEK